MTNAESGAFTGFATRAADNEGEFDDDQRHAIGRHHR